MFSGQMIATGTWPLEGGGSSLTALYLPELRSQASGDWGFADLDLSYRFNATNRGNPWRRGGRWYRAQFRFGGSDWDLRAGLQQLNFGPGRYLRALQWFDTLDPRDPLQLSNGVRGVRLKKYAANSTLQLWALENTSALRGFEWLPGAEESPEWGGRYLLSAHGDWGATVHNRKIRVEAETGDREMETGNEWRFAADGAWDLGPGVWVEGVAIYRDLPLHRDWNQERFLTIGMDYTLSALHGLTVSGEYFGTRLGQRENPVHTVSLGAAELRLPVTLTDQISWIVFSDLKSGWSVSTISWQRILDSWIVYCGWIFQSGSQPVSVPGLGLSSGILLLLVFNH
ncbi:MAG: hypothetical protein ACE5D1_01495 [Fidelibacterota bacterium]